MAELLFASGSLSDLLSAKLEEAKEAVAHASAARIQSQESDELIESVTSRALVTPLEISEDRIEVDQQPTKVNVAGRFEYAWDEEDGPLFVDALEVSIHVPFRGDALLLRLQPSHFTFNPPRGAVSGSEIVLSAAAPPQDAEKIERHLKAELESLKNYVAWSRQDIQSHNTSTRALVTTAVEQRRKRLSEIPDIASNFGLPRKTPSPATAALPTKRIAPNNANIPASTPTLPDMLEVFLCHASQDKKAVRQLHDELKILPVDLWLDEIKLLPGQDWEREIRRALRAADVVVVCLSSQSVTKTGFVQKEIRITLDIADEQPEGAIFLIPARLDECEVPDRLNRWQWVDLFTPEGLPKLKIALERRANDLKKNW